MKRNNFMERLEDLIILGWKVTFSGTTIIAQYNNNVVFNNYQDLDQGMYELYKQVRKLS